MNRIIKRTLAGFSAALLIVVWGSTAASASIVTYSLQSPTTTPTASSYTYGTGSLQLTVNGYNSVNSPGNTSNTAFNPNATLGGGGTVNNDLHTKTTAGNPGETGLGMVNDGDHEISKGNFIQINFSAPIAAFASVSASIVISSIQGSESFSIWASNTLGNPGAFITGGSSSPSVQTVALSGPLAYKYYSVSAPSGNVLIDTVTITTGQTTTPEPATAGLTGLIICAGVAFIQRRRSRK